MLSILLIVLHNQQRQMNPSAAGTGITEKNDNSDDVSAYSDSDDNDFCARVTLAVRCSTSTARWWG